MCGEYETCSEINRAGEDSVERRAVAPWSTSRLNRDAMHITNSCVIAPLPFIRLLFPDICLSNKAY